MNEITAKMIWQAAAGNQEAITQLYELTYSSVYKTVHAMVQDEDTVLDIVQDSYIKGFQSLDQLDAPENFRAWMKRIATNKAKDHLKRKKPILFSEMANEDGEEIDFQDDRLDHCPEEVIDQQETTRLMNEILGTLSEEQRLVIGMFYYEEMTVREIAEVLGCSENTVKSRLNYGRKKVEVKVRELERKGTKLYSLAPLPFLLWLFRMDAQAAEVPSFAVWDAVTTACANTSGSAAGAGTAGTAASSGAGTGPRYAAGTGARSAAGTGARTSARTAASSGAGTGAKYAARSGAKAAATVGAKAAAKTGTKALAAKIIAGVLAAAVVGGGAAVAVTTLSSREDSQENTPTFSAQAQDERLPEMRDMTVPTGEDPAAALDGAYQTVVNNYLATINMDSGAFQAAYDAGALDGIYNGDHQAIRYYHMYHGHSFFTARMDLDGNGVEELLVGIGFDGEPQPGQIVDIYGFDGTQAVQLIDEPTLGDRSQLRLLADNTLAFMGSSGAADNYYENYKVQGCELVSAVPSSAAEATGLNWQILEGHDLTPEAPAGQDLQTVYWDVIYEVLAACADPDEAWLYGAPEHYHFANHLEALYYYHMWGRDVPRDPLFMARWDLDGNGTEEFFIGQGADPASASTIGVFGVNGQEAVFICDGMYSEILADGTVILTDPSGMAERVTRIGPDGYTLADTDSDIPFDDIIFLQDFSSHGGRLRLNWEPLVSPASGISSGASFDTILADIQTVVNTIPAEAYQNDPFSYNRKYSHLGAGITGMLVNRESDIYTLAVWKTFYDADRDGQEELCIGRGVSAGRPITTIAIYKQNGTVITDNGLAACPLPVGVDNAGMPLAGWEYLCG